MGIISAKKVNLPGGAVYNINLERYFSSNEVVQDCMTRRITDRNFTDFDTHVCKEDWEGVSSYSEALDLLKYGYQPTIEELRKAEQVKKAVHMKRVMIHNNIIGYAPIVPLALKNVPCNMLDVSMKPIRRKVIDVYYDITAHCGTDPEDIMRAGTKLLAAMLDLERQGYRFNLYGVQSYTDSSSADVLCVKVKSSDRPLDLKRISFPLTHPGFFRVIGFDWYGKFPKGKYRSGYGCAFQHSVSGEARKAIVGSVFGNNAVYISCTSILCAKQEDYIKEALLDEPTNSRGN